MLEEIERNTIKDIIDTVTYQQEYCHLKGSCYLDHTGAALYTKSQVEAIAQDLCENLYANPHSNSVPSRLTADTVDQVRLRILKHFNTSASEYSVIFTSGATEACKIVAESFDFVGRETILNGSLPNGETSSFHGEFVYLQDNHTSVLGMRNVDNITKNNITVRSIKQNEAFEIFQREPKISSQSEISENNLEKHGNSLFVYSAQCNFSGLKYPLSWVEKVQNGLLARTKDNPHRWFCLLDTATFVSTNELDLSSVQPDFVTVSFYKIFGLPTGLGALLVRNSSARVLHKKYYGGGTVEMTLASQPTQVFRPVLHQRFEDGTINFLSIIALRHGFDWLQRSGLTQQQISLHSFQLAAYTHARLRRLHHSNNTAACVLYADTVYDDCSTQGGIVNFNMRRDDGQFVGFMEVLTLANLHGIHLRTGCFCNPGACQRLLDISDQQYCSNFEAGHVCGDDHDLVDGRPTGSVRVSFAASSTQAHVDRLLNMLHDCFITKPAVYKDPDDWEVTAENLKRKFNEMKSCKTDIDLIKNSHDHKKENGKNEPDKEEVDNASDVTSSTNGYTQSGDTLVLSQICLYPVKSCGAVKVSRWALDSKGLVYDRCWMVVNESGVALTQKLEPKLCLIRPRINLDIGQLVLTFQGFPNCAVPLEMSERETASASLCDSKVCGDNVKGVFCGEEVSQWLCEVLGREGLQLMRQSDSVLRSSLSNNIEPSNLTLSNQAQFLLVNENSVNWLTEKLPEDSLCSKTNMVDRFRSNFVIQGECPAFEEQTWTHVDIGSVSFQVEGPCGRCQMICIDQSTGNKTKEPLTTLAANSRGKLKFGIYLRQTEVGGNAYVSVGDKVCAF